MKEKPKGAKTMATKEQINNFINLIAPLVQEQAKANGYRIASTVIAQACLESGYGESELAWKYHNYFGLKCGGAWKGKSVNMRTWEEYEAGVHTPINDNFRVYDSVEDGVKGYYDFIDWDNYANLKTATTPAEYAYNLKADGYATASDYATTLISIVNSLNLIAYDNFSPNKSLDQIAQEVIRGDWGNGEERKQRLTEAGYDYEAVQNKVDEILNPPAPPKKTNEEIAEEVIKGEWGNGLERKNRLENAGYNYNTIQDIVNELLKSPEPIKKSDEQIAKEVIRGDWGNGLERKRRLTQAGYDYQKIQFLVNKIIRGAN